MILVYDVGVFWLLRGVLRSVGLHCMKPLWSGMSYGNK